MVYQPTCIVWQAPLVSLHLAALQRSENSTANSLFLTIEHHVDPQPLTDFNHLQRTQATRSSPAQVFSSRTKSTSHSTLNPCVVRPLLIVIPRALTSRADLAWPTPGDHGATGHGSRGRAVSSAV